jgi:hypothetical protein
MTEKRTFGPYDPFPEDGTREEFEAWGRATAREALRRRIEEWHSDGASPDPLGEVLDRGDAAAALGDEVQELPLARAEANRPTRTEANRPVWTDVGAGHSPSSFIRCAR